jgi:hypothetical protein
MLPQNVNQRDRLKFQLEKNAVRRNIAEENFRTLGLATTR